MKNKIQICDKCLNNNIEKLLPQLNRLNATIEVGCHNNCGISKNQFFALVNHKPVQAINLDDLLKKIKKVI